MRKSETYRNEIKSYIVRTGMTMTEVVDYLSDEYGWSRSVPNLSGKLKSGSLRYGEAVELADALGYDIVWQKRKDVKYQIYGLRIHPRFYQRTKRESSGDCPAGSWG